MAGRSSCVGSRWLWFGGCQTSGFKGHEEQDDTALPERSGQPTVTASCRTSVLLWSCRRRWVGGQRGSSNDADARIRRIPHGVLWSQASHEVCVEACLVATEIWARSANALPSSKAYSREAGSFRKRKHWHHGKGGSLWSISSIPVSASVPWGRPPCSRSRGGNALTGGRPHLRVRSPIWDRDHSAACPILVTPCCAAVGGRPLFWCPPTRGSVLPAVWWQQPSSPSRSTARTAGVAYGR